MSSNVASFYIPPNITDSYPFSALEDIIAKFLQVRTAWLSSAAQVRLTDFCSCLNR